MDDSHPFRSISIGRPIQLAQYHVNSLPFHFTSIRPTIPEIQLLRNLTLKYPRSRSWVRSRLNVTYYTQYQSEVTAFTIRYIRPPHHGQTSQYHGQEWMTHILIVPCQSATLFLRSSNFRLCLWTFKVKVMGSVKGQCHTVGPVSYQLTFFSFHIDQTNNSWDTAISKFDLVSFHINRTNHSWNMAKVVFDLEKTHREILKKMCNLFSTKLLFNLIR